MTAQLVKTYTGATYVVVNGYATRAAGPTVHGVADGKAIHGKVRSNHFDRLAEGSRMYIGKGENAVLTSIITSVTELEV